MPGAAMPEESPVYASQIRAEQIRTLYQQLPLVLVSNMTIPAIMLGVLWNSAIHSPMLWWTMAMGVVVAVRALFWFAHRHAPDRSARLRRWTYYYLLGTFASGCVWGIAGLLLHNPESPTQLSMLVLALAGTGAGALIAYSAYLPAFFLYFLPSILPFVIILLIEGTRDTVLIASMTLLYVAVLSYYARTFHALLQESWRLRFENIGLVDELTVQKEEAERANAAKSRFLAAASHDLRQPLHAIGLFVSALHKKVRKPETREIVSSIDASVEALQGLFNALLDISRLDAGVIRPRVEDVPVQDLFNRLAREFSELAADKGLALRFVPTVAMVRSDGVLLGRVLRNLVSNAIRYTDTGGVVVGCRRRGGWLRIEVIDSGIGIAPAERERIFQEFYQIGNPERDRLKGLGLGLAIVEQLARLLDHPLEMHSVLGRGSRFVVSAARAREVHAANIAETPVPLVDRLRGALVVMIDDERPLLDGMRLLLSDWGCESVLAGTLEEALGQLAALGRAPDIILADYRLRGGHTGIEVIRALQAVWGSAIPAVIVTGDTAPERLRETQASGHRLLHKPVPPARLRALLSHLLGQETGGRHFTG